MEALGCTPASDQNVVESIKEAGLISSSIRGKDTFEVIRQSILQISKFYLDNVQTFQKVKMKPQGFNYPPMKIMDMVLWKMSFRKSVAQKILSMPSSQNKGKAKVWRSVEEDKAVSDWLQDNSSACSKCFKNGVLKPIRKKKRHSKKRAKRHPKKNYQKLFESFADSLYKPQKKILLNTMPDEE